MKKPTLSLRGVKENNLKNIDLDITHDQLTVVTGLSGSGKSSLAFDTVYAEGQRRYIETFSPYTRQFLDKIKKPAADHISNVRPAVAIQQKTKILNSRSTVGSLTNLNDYLKALWTHIAKPTCPICNRLLISYSPWKLSAYAKELVEDASSETFLVCSEVKLPASKKKTAELLENLATVGYSRFLDPDEFSTHLIEPGDLPPVWETGVCLLVIDRFTEKSFKIKAIQDSIAQSFSISDGTCLLLPVEKAKKQKKIVLKDFAYYQKLRCVEHEVLVPQVRKSLFSYNHPNGACSECNGFGYILKVSQDLCVPNPGLTISEKALHCWSSDTRAREHKKLIEYCKKNKIPTNVPWYKISDSDKEKIFSGSQTGYTSVRQWFKRLERKSYKMHIRVLLSKYREQALCPECHGKRLKREALLYQYDGQSLPDFWQLEICILYNKLNSIKNSLSEKNQLPDVLVDLFSDTLIRLEFLLDLGLSYLTLDRQARTLSGGETQRVNLAAAIGSNLTATHFVLDEPSVGLHPRDTERLIKSVKKLSSKNNSVLVVEHDPDFIRSADCVIEVGPGAGKNGGQIVHNGSYKSWNNKSLLEANIKISKKLKTKQPAITIKNAMVRNLQKVSCQIPLGGFTVLSGVSGSGKSTLVREVLMTAYECAQNKVPQDKSRGIVNGLKDVNSCIYIDQSPLAKSPRANVATYTKIWDTIRQLLANTEGAEARALGRSAFSFNVDQGRCTTCKGAGYIREDMQFLSDVYMPCEDCLGKRFQPIVLEVLLHGHNVHELLGLTVKECKEIFLEKSDIVNSCNLLEALGLDHLTLGHSLSDLSGGEAQRLKLIKFIDKKVRGNSLLVFDEPTTGLHVQDVKLLLNLFSTLKDSGHSVLCIEHNLDVIKSADWVIDLGPEGGREGGKLIYEGPVAGLIKCKESKTGMFLGRSPSTSIKQTKPVNKKLSKSNFTSIKGARQHNLKNIDLEIPLNKIIAFTGVSGSGKSSIAKDILFAEGQRRYLDCLSPYARQFIKGLDKPKVDSIVNIPASIYVGQHVTLPLGTSTIATLSEIYNFLRLLYVKLGTQFCPDHREQKISNLSAVQIVNELKTGFNKHLKILAPIIVKKKGNHKEIISRALSAEINELRVDGIFCRTGSVASGLERNKTHSIDYVVATCNPQQVDQDILEEAVSGALALGAGTVIIVSESEEFTYSSSRSCPVCKRGFFKPDPEDLSFSSKRGCCSQCFGTGLDKKGDTCKTCDGSRLNAIGRNIKLDGKNIAELVHDTPNKINAFLDSIKWSAEQTNLAEGILFEVQSKLKTLVQLGLDHLNLDRDCRTLSSGELQRVRLASVLGSSLSGVLYLLDEPSAGLHPDDTKLVLNTFSALKAKGNTVVVIEHDPDSILSAEHIIELGPSGGSQGGELMFSGSKSKFLKSKTKTARAIRDEKSFSFKKKTRKNNEHLRIDHGKWNNLNLKNLMIPLQSLVVIAGVSGAGKSSLVHGIIADTIADGIFARKKLRWESEQATLYATAEIEKTLLIDQQPIGKNSRSTPASYLGIWNHVRALFAQIPEAKTLGWDASFFSYNTGKGRCQECEGRGELVLEMNFLANARIACDSCNGLRFREEANTIKYLNLSIADVLNLTLNEAKEHFANHPKIRKPLSTACDLGLGYLTLGQSSATLSGGEAQRLRLVAELNTRKSSHTLYIFDEPTTGLHIEDVNKLLSVLNDLIDRGNSVIVIEHDSSVLAAADHIIELGPGPGEFGGKVIYQGTPCNLSKAKTPWSRILNSDE